MFGIDIGYPVTQSSILGDEDYPGYRVWTGVMRYGHGYPDELDDVDICVTRNAGEAITAALQLILDSQITGYFDLRMAEEFAADAKLAEEFHANA